MAEVAPLPERQSRCCPMCGKKENPNYFPFCSKSCADLDLGKWLTENYRISVDEEENVDG